MKPQTSLVISWILALILGIQFLPLDSAAASRFDFALIGDIPYDDYQVTNEFPNLISDLNRAKLAFVVHDGDIKSGSTPCTDELFEQRRIQFQTFRHPLVLIFGDNEWSDCGAVKTNAYAPEERLGKLRSIFATGDRALGRGKLRLNRQNDFPENVRWEKGGVLFAGINAPGPDNHFGTPEFGSRNRANIVWLKESFARARRDQLRAMMIILQANPHFDLPSTNRVRLGFNEMLEVLEKETIAFGKPVVLVHGDSHYFRIDQPLLGSKSKRRLENFTRVETFGHPDAHWLRVTVDSKDPNVFSFRPEYVKKNRIQHGRATN